LPEIIRQIVILTVGSKFGAAYEIYAHGAVASANGMSAQRLATIAANLRPADLTREEGIAYDMTAALPGRRCFGVAYLGKCSGGVRKRGRP
jgi:hypothetical protein